MSETSGRQFASVPQRTHPNGLPILNRDDISYATYHEKRKEGAWLHGDLFAVFRTEFGELRVQVAHFDDYYPYVVEEVLDRDIVGRGVKVLKDDILHLVGMLIISREHPYEFVDFIQLIDHTGAQLFDMNGLITWIAMNQGGILSPFSDGYDNRIMDDEELAENVRELEKTKAV